MTGAAPAANRPAAPPTALVVAPSQDPDEVVDRRPLSPAIVRRLMQWTRPYRGRWLALLLLTSLRSAQLPLLVWMIAHTIGGPITAHDVPATCRWTAAFLLLVIITEVTFHFRMRLALLLGESVVHDLRCAIFAHLQRLTMSFYADTKVGRIISRMTSDVEAVRVAIQDVFFVSVVQVGQMLVAAALMATINLRLFAIIVLLAPILWLINRIWSARLAHATRLAQESFSRVTATLAESVHGIRVTQGFARQERNAALFRALVVDHARYNMRVARSGAPVVPLLDLNSQCFIAVLLIVAGIQALSTSHPLPVQDLILFFFLANLFFSPIQTLGNQYNLALSAMAGAERIFRLLDTRPSWEDPPTAQPCPRLRGEIVVEDVVFGYHPGRPVLHGVSFTVPAGTTTALVGATGCGKSTIINLLAKFYLPDRGRIRIDGIDLAALSTASLHRQLGLVNQTNVLFSGTVLENIRIVRPAATDAEVRAAAQRLDALDVIEALPEGFATLVGERGSGISLGQRQIICFTRALLADPAIMILDEATAAVDTLTEARLQRALDRLLAGRTSVVIAHRLSTIRHADQVILMDQGRVLERGTHRSLLAARGAYARLHASYHAGGALASPPPDGPGPLAAAADDAAAGVVPTQS